MSTRIENKEVLLPEEVASYFPSNIADLFALSNESFSFFGELTRSTNECNEGKGKFYSMYLSLLHDPSQSGIDVSFADSKKTYVCSEHTEFLKLQETYSSTLYSQYPLLVLRLTTEYMRYDKPRHYMNLLRYADHEIFRKKGVATNVLDSVTEKCRSEGIKYLYTCFSKLPSTSVWLDRNDVSDSILEDISSYFFDKPKHKVLQWSDSYLRILKS